MTCASPIRAAACPKQGCQRVSGTIVLSLLRPPWQVQWQQRPFFYDPASARHIQHSCLVCTIGHARDTLVHVVTLKKVVDIVLSMRYSSQERALCLPPCRWRLVYREYDAIDGHGVLGMEPMGAKIRGGRVHDSAAT